MMWGVSSKFTTGVHPTVHPLYPSLPKVFNSAVDFGFRYCDGRKIQFGRAVHYDFKGSSNMDELRVLLEALCMIRRLKADVLSQLPAKRRQTVMLDPNLIKSGRKEMEEKAKLMANSASGEKHGILLEWYSATAKVKVKAVLQYLEDLLESEQKFVCFGHHQIILDSISDLLEDKKIRYIRIDGQTSSKDRNTHCQQFQTDDKTKVALLSVTAANSGITLTSANLVVFAELFWNPGILAQAEDRAHRIGQTDSVTVKYLVANGTADDELWTLLQRKLDVLNEAGLSKDNFRDSNNVQSEAKLNRRSSEGKITDHFSVSVNMDDFDAADPTSKVNDDDDEELNRIKEELTLNDSFFDDDMM